MRGSCGISRTDTPKRLTARSNGKRASWNGNQPASLKAAKFTETAKNFEFFLVSTPLYSREVKAWMLKNT
ncbi:hypothetical protein CWS01_20245 [Niallia nealsonii]|uniref:Uncharacterized protein n=1 Tax=Niallia nealsonii TaxID=115979 RepID=A0A2N0YX95_9BACI|nr:hypothetical protein CWS01_20245 [Niallia nealsonii]